MIIYNKIVNAATRAMWDSELIASRVILGFAELFWSILMLWPGKNVTTPMHINMLNILSENTWGIIFFVSAILQFIIVMINRFNTISARYFAFCNMCLWAFTVFSIITVTYPPPTVIGGEIALAIAAFWIWARPYILIEGYRRATYQ